MVALGGGANRNDGIEDGDDLLAGDALVELDGQSLASEHVEQRKHSQTSPVEQHIRNKIH